MKAENLPVDRNVYTYHDVLWGIRKAECHYCKKEPCFDWVETPSHGGWTMQLLFDKDRIICRDCWTFMNTSGDWYTACLRGILLINGWFKRRRYAHHSMEKRSSGTKGSSSSE